MQPFIRQLSLQLRGKVELTHSLTHSLLSSLALYMLSSLAICLLSSLAVYMLSSLSICLLSLLTAVLTICLLSSLAICLLSSLSVCCPHLLSNCCPHLLSDSVLTRYLSRVGKSTWFFSLATCHYLVPGLATCLISHVCTLLLTACNVICVDFRCCRAKYRSYTELSCAFRVYLPGF